MGVFNAIIRAIVAFVIVATGLFLAVVTAVVAAVLFLIRRPRVSMQRSRTWRSAPFPDGNGEVIDVTATEVSVDEKNPTQPALVSK